MTPPRADGSVVKRESPRVGRKSRTYWYASIELAPHDDGRRRRVGKSFPSEALALDWLGEQRVDRDRGIATARDQITVGDLLDAWRMHLEAIGRTPATLAGYDSIISAHLRPALGTLKVGAPILPARAQALVDRLLVEGRKPTTVRNVTRVLHAALEYGRRQRLVADNAAGLLELPKTRRADISPLSLAEAKTFLEAARAHRLGTLYLLTLTLGLRQSEVIGLHWSDVDLEASTLVIRQRAYRVSGKVHVGLPKSEASRRELALPAPVVELLKAQRTKMLTDGIASTIVFPNTRGAYLYGPWVTRAMQRLLEDAGIPRRRFHDLRHTAATLLRMMGADIKEVQAVLGHADYRLTADTYTHILDDARRAPAARMTTLLSSFDELRSGNGSGNDDVDVIEGSR